MKTRKITESQLREMIKESLEESIVEIGEDDERSKLSRLGSRRTPEQNRKYKQLLESKLRRLHEDLGQQQVLPGFGSATAEEGAKLKGEKQKIEVDDIIKLLKVRLTKLYALEDKLEAGQTFAVKMSSPLGKKAGNVLAKSTMLQALIDKAENAQEVVDMVMSLLEDVINSQNESEQAKP